MDGSEKINYESFMPMRQVCNAITGSINTPDVKWNGKPARLIIKLKEVENKEIKMYG